MNKHRWRKRTYGVVLLSALLLAGLAVLLPNQPDQAFARSLHAVLIHSEPAAGSVLARPPTDVQLWFSEPVQLVGQTLTIFGPEGGTVKQGVVQEQDWEVSVPLNASTEGTYLVNWQVISQDTDPVSGSFVFSVGHPGGPWAETVSSNGSAPGFWLQVLAHLLHFLGYALSFGSLAFLCLVVYPLDYTRQETLQQPIWRLVNSGILILLCAEGVALVAQTASLGEHSLFDLTFLGAILGSSFGRVLALRLGAALTLWILLGIAQQGNRKAVIASLVLGGVLALIDSTASHAISSPVIWLALLATTLHIAAMATWLGGVIALLALWRLETARTERQALVARFRPLAIASVAELVFTGIILAGLHLTRLTDLLTVSYGRVLLIKAVALFLPLLFASLNHQKRQFFQKRWWWLEVLALLGIVALAAMLVSLAPPR